MSVTITEALTHLNVPDTSDDVEEIEFFLAAANEWIAERITDTSPTPVKLATLFLLDHLWDSQRGPAATPLDGNEVVQVAGVGYAIPNRVLELIDPYRTKARPRGSFPSAVAWPDPVEWPV